MLTTIFTIPTLLKEDSAYTWMEPYEQTKVQLEREKGIKTIAANTWRG